MPISMWRLHYAGASRFKNLTLEAELTGKSVLKAPGQVIAHVQEVSVLKVSAIG